MASKTTLRESHGRQAVTPGPHSVLPPLNRLSACDAQTQAKSPDCFMVILLMTLAGAADSQQDSTYCFRSNLKTKHLKNERENKELQ